MEDSIDINDHQPHLGNFLHHCLKAEEQIIPLSGSHIAFLDEADHSNLQSQINLFAEVVAPKKEHCDNGVDCFAIQGSSRSAAEITEGLATFQPITAQSLYFRDYINSSDEVSESDADTDSSYCPDEADDSSFSDDEKYDDEVDTKLKLSFSDDIEDSIPLSNLFPHLLINNVHRNLQTVCENRDGNCDESINPDGDTVNSSVPFTGTEGIPFDTTGFDCVRYFQQFLTDEIIAKIVAETNRYADQFIRKHREKGTMHKYSRAHRWKETTSDEMKTFIGLTILMGIVKKPSTDDYWSTDHILTTPIFGAAMTRDRFQLLLKFLHFADNEHEAPTLFSADVNPLWKIQTVMDLFLKQFECSLGLCKNLAIDESLILWKGRLLFKQYIPSKRMRYGIKLYLLCESPSGYVYRCMVFSGKHPASNGMGASGSVVLQLMQGLLNKGHHLYVDNWYTSSKLFLFLHENQTLACGTLRQMNGIPTQIQAVRLEKHESKALTCGPLLITKYADKKDVFVLSSIHSEHKTTAVSIRKGRQNQAIQKPICIVDYNKYMCAVDRVDQMLHPYNIMRKSLKWYKKLVMHFIQMSLLNAFILRQKAVNDKMTYLDFCKTVVKSLIMPAVQRRSLEGTTGHGINQTKVVSISSRLKDRHIIAKLPKSGLKGRQRKKCRVCSSKGKRKDTVYCCPGCPDMPALCMGDCFATYHTKKTLDTIKKKHQVKLDRKVRKI